ncbi:hypothetical protein NQD34_014549 [Periophthalmus magnuspinnatus]|nr:hypothetical protein NQD34_014549 [Periophthalmus magnuspinnatus]
MPYHQKPTPPVTSVVLTQKGRSGPHSRSIYFAAGDRRRAPLAPLQVDLPITFSYLYKAVYHMPNIRPHEYALTLSSVRTGSPRLRSGEAPLLPLRMEVKSSAETEECACSVGESAGLTKAELSLLTAPRLRLSAPAFYAHFHAPTQHDSSQHKPPEMSSHAEMEPRRQNYTPEVGSDF